ncbi:MAG: HipA domain-containing protein [Oscillospiraceae bacterium]
MNCLCCGKPLEAEEPSGWHKSCIMRFFGTTEFPELDTAGASLERLAAESAEKGLTVTGVQKKLPIHLKTEGKRHTLTAGEYPTGYILKPQVKDYRALPEAEQLVMSLADEAGISTVPHALVKSGGSYAYITKRIDRVTDESGVKKLAMEDFCQLEMRLTSGKYRGSYEQCAKLIKRYSSRGEQDVAELFYRIVFNFITCNSDMHLKNFSLIETEVGSGSYVLSPAYDLVPVNVIMPEDNEQTALTINGKKQNIRRKDFRVFAYRCGITQESEENMINRLVSMKPRFIAMCGESLLPEDMKERFAYLIEERCRVFE